jgi:AcrR family transcriptional regulator
MRSIAENAGITIQLLTHHAKSKENLWKMVVEHLSSEYEKVRAATPKLSPQASASEHLRTLIADSVRFTAALPEVHRLVTLEAAHLTPRLLYLMETFTRKPYGEFCTLIKRAQREGTVRMLNPARLRFAIVAMAAVPFSVAAEYEHLTGKNPFSPSEIERTIDLINDLVFHTVPE